MSIVCDFKCKLKVLRYGATEQRNCRKKEKFSRDELFKEALHKKHHDEDQEQQKAWHTNIVGKFLNNTSPLIYKSIVDISQWMTSEVVTSVMLTRMYECENQKVFLSVKTGQWVCSGHKDTET